MLLGTLAVTVSLVAAGCGGSSSDDASATEQWANGLCSALVTWTDTITAAGGVLQDPGSLSADSFKSAIEDSIDATETLVDDVRSLGAPETDAGEEAQDAVELAADSLSESAEQLQGDLDDAGNGLTGLLSKVTAITRTVSGMSTTVSQLFSSFGEIDAGGELEEAFQDADECQPIVNPSG
jgi:hypothetical protein